MCFLGYPLGLCLFSLGMPAAHCFGVGAGRFSRGEINRAACRPHGCGAFVKTRTRNLRERNPFANFFITGTQLTAMLTGRITAFAFAAMICAAMEFEIKD